MARKEAKPEITHHEAIEKKKVMIPLLSDDEDDEDRSDSNDDVLVKLSNLSTKMELLWHDNSHHTLWQRDYVVQCYREKPHVNLTEYAQLDGAEYSWITTNRIQTVSEKYPHCKCVVVQDIEPDEELKRSEILPILVFMRWRMGLYYYQQHEVFPVEVLSLYGGQARILIPSTGGECLLA
ncbi:predicted protein [Uncinocarpus reesii 1704]|uniref:Uncharacterized protein n=1 Tax=Uncinocarpus reesii (strain UAMH 1704) TaxID=336963 RepID=C4JN57_UNCRE|nr:uncharacterized protein UREG_04265 [Uncinocarpus reesii 1704]EEP79419.1 predicted protein [Uncinocarpus reesii 1704]